MDTNKNTTAYPLKSSDDEMDIKKLYGNNYPIRISFGITLLGGKVHESITKEAFQLADMSYGKLLDGVQWPDAPDESGTKTSKLGAPFKLKQVGTITHDSHHGKYQIWHSMAPDDGTQ